MDFLIFWFLQGSWGFVCLAFFCMYWNSEKNWFCKPTSCARWTGDLNSPPFTEWCGMHCWCLNPASSLRICPGLNYFWRYLQYPKTSKLLGSIKSSVQPSQPQFSLEMTWKPWKYVATSSYPATPRPVAEALGIELPQGLGPTDLLARQAIDQFAWCRDDAVSIAMFSYCFLKDNS